MWIFVVAAAAEALVAPLLVGGLLLGADLNPARAAIARFGGLAFVGFALACWPAGGSGGGAIWARRALWVFQPAAAICLVLVTVTTGLSGILLWPAVAYHAFATVALARPAIARSPLGKDALR